MAEITFDKFWGWMSPTSLYAKPWECAYLEWIDATQNISLVENSPTWKKEFLTDWNDMTQHFTATGSITSREWYAWEGGQIYIDTSSDDVPEKQLSNTNDILDNTSILWGIWLIQKGGWDRVEVSRMDEEQSSLGNITNFNEALWISDNDSIDWAPENTHIRGFWEAKLIIVKGSKVYELGIIVDAGQSWGYNLSELSIRDIGRAVVWLSVTTDFLKLYTKDGRILMYNKSFTLVSETQTWELLHDVVTSNNRDYIVWEDGFYYVEGNNLIPIIKDWDKGLYNISNNRKIFNWRNYVFVEVEVNGVIKLLRIWTDNAGFPEAMTIMWAVDESWNTVNIYYWVGGRFALSAWMNVTTTLNWLYSLSGSRTNAQWVIMTEKFNAWSQLSVKAIWETKVAWSFNGNTTIETIFNDDETSTPTSLNNWWEKKDVLKFPDLNWEFLDFVYKVELKGSDQLYWITSKYTNDKN